MDLELTRLKIEQLPHYKRRTRDEFSAACPYCNAGDDRFRFWPDTGNFWCRQCGAKGFITDAPGGWSADERAAFMAEAAERARQEREAKRAAVEAMAACGDLAQRYHAQMDGRRGFWYAKGLGDRAIDDYVLGYTPECPTYHASPSWTIPVFFRGKLLNIRHRLQSPPTPGDKYRPERAGLPAVMFNADWLLEPRDSIVVVEGEIKAMVLSQAGFPAVGIPGANIFPARWAGWFNKTKTVYVALDPGAERCATEIVQMIGSRARLCSFPVKPDDFMVVYHGTEAQMKAYLEMGRRLC